MKKGFFRPVRDLKIERKSPGGAVQIWKRPVFQKKGSISQELKNVYPVFPKKAAFLSAGKGSAFRPFQDFQQQHC
jgi:hypothetical protein